MNADPEDLPRLHPHRPSQPRSGLPPRRGLDPGAGGLPGRRERAARLPALRTGPVHLPHPHARRGLAPLRPEGRGGRRTSRARSRSADARARGPGLARHGRRSQARPSLRGPHLPAPRPRPPRRGQPRGGHRAASGLEGGAGGYIRSRSARSALRIGQCSGRPTRRAIPFNHLARTGSGHPSSGRSACGSRRGWTPGTRPGEERL